MGVTTWLALLIFHPLEFKTLLQFHFYLKRKRDIQALKDPLTSGWNRESMRRCWGLLDQTGRSFSLIIKQLDGDLARPILTATRCSTWASGCALAVSLFAFSRPICLFYLVLRALDTIEDDMTIPDGTKQSILRKFDEYTVTPGWKFDGNSPKEKDRQLLVEYNVIVDEVNLLLPCYKNIIIDITQKMQVGMADYAHKAATTGAIYLETVSEYDLYCHYVSGLAGEGLSRIFSASGKEADWLGEELELSNSLGLLVQKTDIIRDYREDIDQHRFYWPREIWGKFGFKDMRDMSQPESLERAQWAQSAMVVDALRHATDALEYLRCLKNPTIFSSCAILTTMIIASLELCFMNRDMFQQNIKIRKATAAQLIMRSTNIREVGLIFCEYAHKIHAKAVPSDPNFIRISIACGRIEQWYEQNYPSFIQPPSGTSAEPSLDPSDARSIIAKRENEFTAELASRKRMVELAKGDRKLVLSLINYQKSNGKFSASDKERTYLGNVLISYASAAAFIRPITSGLRAFCDSLVSWTVGSPHETIND